MLCVDEAPTYSHACVEKCHGACGCDIRHLAYACWVPLRQRTKRIRKILKLLVVVRFAARASEDSFSGKLLQITIHSGNNPESRLRARRNKQIFG